MGASPLFRCGRHPDRDRRPARETRSKHHRTGLYLKVPFVQEVTYFDKRLLDYDSNAQDVITSDKKTLLLDNLRNGALSTPLKVYQNFQSQRGALQRLHDIIYSELRVELGRHELLEIVWSARADIMKVVTERAKEKAAGYGIDIQDVRIKRADLPEQNEKAVFARMQAERPSARPNNIERKAPKKRRRFDQKRKKTGRLSSPSLQRVGRASRRRGRQSLPDLCRRLPTGSEVFRVYAFDGGL